MLELELHHCSHPPNNTNTLLVLLETLLINNSQTTSNTPTHDTCTGILSFMIGTNVSGRSSISKPSHRFNSESTG